MRRVLFATAALLALVTAPVTSAKADWNIFALVSAPQVPPHGFVYRDNVGTIDFPTKVACETWLNGDDFAVDVREPFENYEGLEHGANTSIVWVCTEKPVPQTNL